MRWLQETFCGQVGRALEARHPSRSERDKLDACRQDAGGPGAARMGGVWEKPLVLAQVIVDQRVARRPSGLVRLC